jgi:hypothetical protein
MQGEKEEYMDQIMSVASKVTSWSPVYNKKCIFENSALHSYAVMFFLASKRMQITENRNEQA